MTFPHIETLQGLRRPDIGPQPACAAGPAHQTDGFRAMRDAVPYHGPGTFTANRPTCSDRLADWTPGPPVTDFLPTWVPDQ